jgi:hypothetical protein
MIDADALVYELTEIVRHSTGEYKHGIEAARLVVMDTPPAVAPVRAKFTVKMSPAPGSAAKTSHLGIDILTSNPPSVSRTSALNELLKAASVPPFGNLCFVRTDECRI